MVITGTAAVLCWPYFSRERMCMVVSYLTCAACANWCCTPAFLNGLSKGQAYVKNGAFIYLAR